VLIFARQLSSGIGGNQQQQQYSKGKKGSSSSISGDHQ
jgi:hypothetical protein